MIPLRWTTEIVEWCSPHRFMDVQLRGPYRLWQHTHRFEPFEGGTRMTDEVEYALPLGPLGRLAHALKVRRDLEAVFDYRAERIRGIFSNPGQGAPA
jgi:ligand-binding SRPBCC domain-containing protein